MHRAAARRPLARPLASLLVGVAIGFAAAACSSGGSGTPAASNPGPSEQPQPSWIHSAEDAAAAVAATNPLFEGISKHDPELIGQGSWWEATPLIGYTPGSWQVVYTIGWGDCQAGCIDQHTWTYQVAPDGTVTLISEEGSPLASDVLDGAGLDVRAAGGGPVAQATSDASGLFRLDLDPGDYTLEPRPADGLLGTAAPVPFTVDAGSETFLEIGYDTGIR
jgi:uncharacterized surface anchored protein